MFGLSVGWYAPGLALQPDVPGTAFRLYEVGSASELTGINKRKQGTCDKTGMVCARAALHVCEGRYSREHRSALTIDAPRAQRRQHQDVTGRVRDAVARTAGVPAAVVQLVAQVWHRQPVDYL